MLTQAFTATLEAAECLSAELVSGWLSDPGVGGVPRVTPQDVGVSFRAYPQQRLASGDKIDLALEFLDTQGAITRLVWVEVKHHSSLSDEDQLLKYHRQLADFPPSSAERHLVFLPPAGFVVPPDQKPEGLVQTSWHRVGKFVDAWRKAQPSESREAWIAQEFVSFLREEKLFVCERFTRDHLEHLRAAELAEQTFGVILEEAARQIYRWVEAGGIPRGDEADYSPKRGSWWPSFWQTFGTSTDLLGGWCEWYLQVPDGRERAAFGAGLAFLPSASPTEETWQRLRWAGLERADLDLGCARAFHWWGVDDFVDKTQGGNQVKELVSFVLGSFREVRRGLRLPEVIP